MHTCQYLALDRNSTSDGKIVVILLVCSMKLTSPTAFKPISVSNYSRWSVLGLLISCSVVALELVWSDGGVNNWGRMPNSILNIWAHGCPFPLSTSHECGVMAKID